MSSYSLPSQRAHHNAPNVPPPSGSTAKKLLRPFSSSALTSRRPMASAGDRTDDRTSGERSGSHAGRDPDHGHRDNFWDSLAHAEWWRIRLFRGVINDLRRRTPYYWSDWKDAFDYRVVPATCYMYFANILPALAFSLDMFAKTHQSFGVNEVLLSSVLGAVVFSLLAAQPLTIVGVTGPITVFNYTVYDIITSRGTNYFAFMAWIGIWALIMHWILAFTNSCNALKYVTRFSCDTFGFYVAFIYLQKGIQVLTRQWANGDASAYLSIAVALLVLMTAYAGGVIGNSTLFHRYVRKFIEDYATPLTIVFFTGFVHIGKMSSIDVQTLPTGKAFFPTQERGWFIHFWDISVADVFLAIPFALLLTILFWFDHNVSSLMAQGSEFPLRKPAGFHWDLFLLGLTTGVAGLLGLPFPNGLIPQAPFHTGALCVTRTVSDEDESQSKGHTRRVVDHVVEQRVSNLAQGLLTLGTMTGPLLIVIGLVPQAVLAGLFFVMGVQALEANGITVKLLYLAQDSELTPKSNPLKRVRRRAVWGFVACELIGFGATFAITQTIAAIGFPVFILLLMPLRSWLMPKGFFRPEELAVLDQPTASAAIMEAVGGAAYGHGHSDSSDEAVDSEDTVKEKRTSLEDEAERGEAGVLGSVEEKPDQVESGPSRDDSQLTLSQETRERNRGKGKQ